MEGKSLYKFYRGRKAEILEIHFPYESNEEVLETMRSYIERVGRPFNYLRSKEDMLNERMEYLKAQEEKWRIEQKQRAGVYMNE